MPKTLNELTLKYLNENGIKISFFAEYLGVDYSIVNKWLYGKKNMNKEAIMKVHQFLEESHKPVERIYKEEA